MHAIEAHELSKSFRVATASRGMLGALRALLRNDYREIHAVERVSFTIPYQEFVGYIGPNGAGKSTTIKMLSGILHPTSGHVKVAGFSPQRQRVEVARRIGVLFGQRTQLWWDLPVLDSFELLAAMYHVPAATLTQRLKRFDDLLGTGEFLDVPVRKLSLGQRMRADLAAALLHNPPVLFLDEPTIGLDVIAKQRVRHFLREINRTQGTTILLTTHDMDDIEFLCSRVIVINHGRVAFDGDMKGLRARAGTETMITVEYADVPVDSLDGPWQLLETRGTRITVSFDPAYHTAGEIINRLSQYGDVRDIRVQETPIETVIERMYASG